MVCEVPGLLASLGLLHGQARKGLSEGKHVQPDRALALAGLRGMDLTSPRHSFAPQLLPQRLLVLLQLPLEAKVGQYLWPCFSYESNGLFEVHFFLAHEVGNNQR